jgi:predicted nucleic acid-binding protein
MAKLVDASLWIDFTRLRSPRALKDVIAPHILDPEACLAEPIAFEMLRYANEEEARQLSAQFETMPILPTPSDLWSVAAKLGQQCRRAGITAGSIDLLIATIAIPQRGACDLRPGLRTDRKSLDAACDSPSTSAVIVMTG